MAINYLSKIVAAISTVIFFSVAQDLQAKDSMPIVQQLWQGITAEESDLLKKISAQAKSGNYEEAFKYIQENPSSPLINFGRQPRVFDVMEDIVLWNKYSGNLDNLNVDFSDISRFVTDNPFYPNIANIERNVEKIAIKNDVPYEKSSYYFDSNPAGTTKAKIFLLGSKIKFLQRFKGDKAQERLLKEEIRQLMSDIWVKEDFSEEQEADFLRQYKDQLTENDYVKRINRLLWEGATAKAQKNMQFVDEDNKKLFNAIIKIQSFPRYIDQIILSVPRWLRSNEVLSYRRALWYKSKGRVDDLIDVILDLPKEIENPEEWWSLRHLYAREMLKKKEYKLAYLLAAKNALSPEDPHFWEAQWTSGWIALRFLDEPEEAYKHFEKLYNNVVQPVTIARASYWLGMASLAMGDKNKAIEWYKVAAQYPTFFYGQLAINKHRTLDSINARGDIILPEDPEITPQDMKAISNSKAARIAYLLEITGDSTNAEKIFKYIVINAETKGQVAVIMKVINETGNRYLDATISRSAAKKNVFFIKDKFQIVEEVYNDEHAPLVHAIIKQESGFAPLAVSRVGALGFMQLMPGTAKLVTKNLGISYDQRKLTQDIGYNVKIGTSYMKSLLDRFDGSTILAIAAYNAGPNNSQRWINEFYDPRKEKDLDKVVDWIELITYSETRNYVQRIMENLIVYKYLMSRTNYDAID